VNVARPGAPAIIVCDDAEALTRRAAAMFRAAAAAAAAAGRRFCVSLAGGSTPRGLYRLLAAPEAPADAVDWSNAEIFFGDERAVPPDHPDSNFRMVREALLEPALLPPSSINRMAGEATHLAAAASIYEQTLRREVPGDPDPILDLALLGMGADGHTASLFPGTTALDERQRLCVAVDVPQLKTRRLTLTYPVFLRARAVLFLITGADKAEALKAVVEGPDRPRELPSQVIVRGAASVSILCDRAAASALAGSVTTKGES
jgi:6-phosphogluconolactonase